MLIEIKNLKFFELECICIDVDDGGGKYLGCEIVDG